MKKLLTASAAVLAIAAVASPASAQTDQRHYTMTGTVSGSGGDLSITNPAPGSVFELVGEVAAGQIPGSVTVGGVPVMGTRYTAQADAPADSETATPEVNVVFTLSGTVNKDCSFYAGNNADARNIDFGVIGVRTGDNENVNNAFEMVGAATAEIETLTAGCNFNNEVVITKDNADGMVNAAAGGYDTDEFQANIPYEVTASWTGVAVGTVASGTGQSLAVGTGDLSGTLQQGAWRSDMSIDIVAPAITSLGLVAGDYTGTTTLTLRAL